MISHDSRIFKMRSGHWFPTDLVLIYCLLTLSISNRSFPDSSDKTMILELLKKEKLRWRKQFSICLLLKNNMACVVLAYYNKMLQ